MHSQVKRSSSLAGMNPGGGGSASSPGATCTSFPWPRDEQGRTVLQLSVLHRHLPCAVRLLEAGADAEELRECEQRDEEIDELCSALLGAFAGAESDKSRLQSALKSLDPAERNVARTQWPGISSADRCVPGIDDDPDAGGRTGCFVVSLRSLRGFKWAVLGLLAVVCCIA
ncbi:unnamed protein product [Cladocopium goreaui]|uniref:Uncharacterized protein n=1 Tax=Cladocopium goreaui TaxID=2562237 RepID=A0A9P1CIC7_9DINO|nr:unnamed protein product [Cladocopium goreaui]